MTSDPAARSDGTSTGTKAQAEACSKAARNNGYIKAEQGYDFGYCAPGSITELDDGRFEVCIP